MNWVIRSRRIFDKLGFLLPLPKINPNIVSGLSVLCSFVFLFLFKTHAVFAMVLLIVILLLDWFDGLIAKKYRLESEEGYICDVAADRFSEGIIFVPFFNPWFFLFVFNNLLSLYSYKYKTHVSLPLRHVFVIYFLVRFVI